MIVEPAPAKINLALHVRARRADGYHDIETLFAFLRDGDELRFVEAETASFAVTGPFATDLAGDGDNLVLRAAAAFTETFGARQAFAITLEKRLPVASGIGGGSADAAATLRALAGDVGIALDDSRLIACAKTLGADVPVCLLGRSAIGTGRGDELEAIDGLTDIPVLLVNPGVAVSTGAVFRAWDGIDRGALGQGTPLDLARSGRNDLQPPALSLAPIIGEVLATIESAPGVVLARMSGSGATCFGLFGSAAARAAAAEAINASHPSWWCLESALA